MLISLYQQLFIVATFKSTAPTKRMKKSLKSDEKFLFIQCRCGDKKKLHNVTEKWKAMKESKIYALLIARHVGGGNFPHIHIDGDKQCVEKNENFPKFFFVFVVFDNYLNLSSNERREKLEMSLSHNIFIAHFTVEC